jgi:outer membrane biogenesis lipoprotein LolB
MKERQMRPKLRMAILAVMALTACNEQSAQQNQPTIKVRSTEQDRLKQLDAFNLAIGLKHANE